MTAFENLDDMMDPKGQEMVHQSWETQKKVRRRMAAFENLDNMMDPKEQEMVHQSQEIQQK